MASVCLLSHFAKNAPTVRQTNKRNLSLCIPSLHSPLFTTKANDGADIQSIFLDPQHFGAKMHVRGRMANVLHVLIND